MLAYDVVFTHVDIRVTPFQSRGHAYSFSGTAQKYRQRVSLRHRLGRIRPVIINYNRKLGSESLHDFQSIARPALAEKIVKTYKRVVLLLINEPESGGDCSVDL
jgi:hypothetical protein